MTKNVSGVPSCGLARGLARGFRRGHRSGVAFLGELHRIDRQLVKRDGGERERDLAQRVRRGEHGGHDEGDENGDAPLGLELRRGDQPGAGEQRQQHRQLEADAEGEDQRHDQ